MVQGSADKDMVESPIGEWEFCGQGTNPARHRQLRFADRVGLRIEIDGCDMSAPASQKLCIKSKAGTKDHNILTRKIELAGKLLYFPPLLVPVDEIISGTRG